MAFRGLTAGVAVVCAGLSVVAALIPPVATARTTRSADQDSVSALRQSVLDGSLRRTHQTINGCVVTDGGTKYHLGCDHSVVASSADASKPLTTATPAGLGPDDLARAFALPEDPGKAGTVGIVTVADDPNLESDLATYRSQYNLPPCTTANGCLTVVGKDGGPRPAPTANLPGLNQLAQSYTMETMLDVEMTSAACPRCKIVVVEQPIDLIALGAGQLGLPQAAAQNEATAVNTAIRLGANAVSISYFIGNGRQPNILTSGALAESLYHPGVAIVEASGDYGFLGTAAADQNWPQELPWVISAGGVELTSADGGRTFDKKAWGKVEVTGKYMASSSGCATMLPPANGQPSAVSALCGGHRAASDISAAATNLAFYLTYLPATGGPGGWGIALGTSASSPYIAGLYARAGTAGVDGPNTLYQAPAGAIEDVTSGSNTQTGAAGCKDAPVALCVSGPGWDGPTGLGVPHGLGAFQR
ncbi:S8 family serine peptidase [Kutzneria viridogrisea]|uniref:Peptidase S53 domain-containing protein n=2 Tax=Kutzneria TaxID=43356 RepID=W5WHD5_9PSEU|nr:S8 family serine peptidase [Kutzneria albida]AHI00131.1 hypothetical protein KALB_6772 [Kutzneria albida DSM 43870]MBA8925310.1 subtilase family serine protease [Kutzneria viridogrisea]